MVAINSLDKKQMISANPKEVEPYP